MVYATVAIVAAILIGLLVRGWYRAGKTTQEADQANKVNENASEAAKTRHRLRVDPSFRNRVREHFFRD